MAKPRKLYWIKNDKGGGIGSWETKAEALKAIAKFQKPGLSFYIEEHEVDTCPTCGKPCEKDLLEDYGECLLCEKVRGDVTQEDFE